MILAKQDNWVLKKTDITDKTSADQRQEVTNRMPLTADIFKTCPFLDYVFQNQTVLFVLILGSTSRNLTTPWSDYDLVVFTKEQYQPKQKYTLEYNNQHIHWYYKTIDNLVDMALKESRFLYKMNLFFYHFIDDNSLIYLNNEYIDVWNKFKTSFHLLAKICISTITPQVLYFIKRFLSASIENFDKLPLKFYHHFIEILYYLNNTPRDIDYLIKIKSMRYCPLSDDVMKRLKNDLIACEQVLLKYDCNITELIKEWNSIWNFENPQ